MLIRDLAKNLKIFREANSLSQADLARTLGITQATISRIEAEKQLPRPEHLQKIINLLNHFDESLVRPIKTQRLPEPQAVNFHEEYHQFTRTEWNYFKASLPQGQVGGDILLVKELKKRSQVGVLVGDSVGHGAASTYMAFALEFAYTSIASTIHESLLSPELFDKAIANAIVKTARYWRGEPSMIILQANLETSQVSLINRGMPHPIFLSGEPPSFVREKRTDAFNLQHITQARSMNKSFEAGESILLHSDGLYDLMPEDEILHLVHRLSKMFRGDSRAIGRNLIRHMLKNASNKNISDDVSFLILSRAKRGR